MKRFIKEILYAIRVLYWACKRIPIYRILDYYKLYISGKVSINEYLNFQMWEKSSTFRNSFLSYDQAMVFWNILNPSYYACIARDKYLTNIILNTTNIPHSKLYAYYNPEIKSNNNFVTNEIKDLFIIISTVKKPFVIKPSANSAHGQGVLVCKSIDSNSLTITKFNDETISLNDVFDKKHSYLIEEMVIQNDQMMKFNPSSVNTVRIMTALYPDQKVKIFAVFVKIGRKGSCVDNAGNGGNIDCGVQVETGQLYNALQFDSWEKIKSIDSHPDSGAKLNGVIIDCWNELKELVMDYQRRIPQLKTIGWDVALTDYGPVIIEINNWWDTTGQLFIDKGWKEDVQDCYNAWKNYYSKR